MTSASATTQDDQVQSHSNNVRSVSPYSRQEQLDALNSLLKGSENPDFDARHIFGYGSPQHELSMLQTITATRILDVEKQRQPDAGSSSASMAHLEQQARAFREKHGPVLNLQHVIQQQAKKGRMALAAEFKRASPSKGIMAHDLNLTAAQQTFIYAKAGADIISVLTEPRWFLGGFDDLTQARLSSISDNMNHKRPAILAKEFITQKYLIAQAAASGADTCLLIVAVLPQHLLATLIDYARQLDMEPLVEVHAMPELDVALQAGAKVIGVNNRNLHTFQMDLQNSQRVAEEMKRRGLDCMQDYTLCALSGMSSATDVHRYRLAGLQMCLIGESLMRSTHPDQAISGLCLDAADYENSLIHGAAVATTATTTTTTTTFSAGGAYMAGTQLVKVCGITNPEDARVACQAGAHLIGVIFAEKSKRKVSPQQAKAVVEAVRSFGERKTRYEFDLPPNNAGGNPLRRLVASAHELTQAATTRRPLVVGVFQNQEADFIAQMVQECGLDLVQLHGKEGFAAANPAKCGGVPAIRVVDVTVDPATGKASESTLQDLLLQLTADPAAILLDTALNGDSANGGCSTGTTFDWKLALQVQNAGLPVLVAGGLTPDNVGECIYSTNPFGVDVSSGVEARPGIKDVESVRAFVRAARQAATQANPEF